MTSGTWVLLFDSTPATDEVLVGNVVIARKSFKITFGRPSLHMFVNSRSLALSSSVASRRDDWPPPYKWNANSVTDLPKEGSHRNWSWTLFCINKYLTLHVFTVWIGFALRMLRNEYYSWHIDDEDGLTWQSVIVFNINLRTRRRRWPIED